MPVLSKKKYKELINALDERIENLYEVLESRVLETANEGLKRRLRYKRPESMCATKGQDYEIRLAIEDFKAILAEIKKLK